MCKHADKPCPGCVNHPQAEPEWTFLTPEERRIAERQPGRDSGPRDGEPGDFNQAL